MKGFESQDTWKSFRVVRWLPVLSAAILSLTLVTSLTLCVFEGKGQRLDRLPFIAPYLFQFGIASAAILGCGSFGLVFSVIKQHKYISLTSLALGLGSMASLHLYTVIPSEENFSQLYIRNAPGVFLVLYFWMMFAHGLVTCAALRLHENKQTSKQISHMSSLRYTLLALMAGSSLVYSLAYLNLSHTTQLIQNYFGIMAFLISAGYLATFVKELTEVKVGWTLTSDQESRALLQSTFS